MFYYDFLELLLKKYDGCNLNCAKWININSNSYNNCNSCNSNSNSNSSNSNRNSNSNSNNSNNSSNNSNLSTLFPFKPNARSVPVEESCCDTQ